MSYNESVNNNNNIFLPSQLAYSKNYLIKQITNKITNNIE